MLARAASRLQHAQRLLSRPGPRLLSAVPVLGRSLDVEVAAVRAAASTLTAVRTSVAAGQRLVAGGAPDPAALRALSAQVQAAAAAAEQDVQDLAALPLAGTPTAVARTAREVREELRDTTADLRRAAVAARVAAALLGADRPRTVLVALQNNAELQGSGGYVSSYALAQVRGGDVQVGPFQDVIAVSDLPEDAQRVPAPAELQEDYGPYLADTTLWRTWTMSPDVPEVAQVGARVAGRLLSGEPDVVLMLDVPALSALAEVTGGVVLDGDRLSGEQLERALLVDAYDDAGLEIEAQVARRERLQAAASAAVRGVLEAPDPSGLARALTGLAAGRHVSLWSAVPGEQRLLERLGVSGALGTGCSDLVSVNVNNLNANKLDYYVDRQVEVDVVAGPDADEVVQRVRLRNDAPEGLVDYVAGAVEPRVAVERVELSAGPRAQVRSLTVDGVTAEGTVRASADRVRVATAVRLRPGRTVELVLRYRLPRDGDLVQVDVVPQPLARDAQLSLRVQAGPGLALLDPDHGAVQPHGLRREGPLAVAERWRALVAPARPEPSGLVGRLERWWDRPLAG